MPVEILDSPYKGARKHFLNVVRKCSLSVANVSVNMQAKYCSIACSEEPSNRHNRLLALFHGFPYHCISCALGNIGDDITWSTTAHRCQPLSTHIYHLWDFLGNREVAVANASRRICRHSFVNLRLPQKEEKVVLGKALLSVLPWLRRTWGFRAKVNIALIRLFMVGNF